MRGHFFLQTGGGMFRLVVQWVFTALMVTGLEISTKPNRVLELAVGDSVTLGCQFTTAPEDIGPLEIEWSVKSIRHPTEKEVVLMYAAGQIFDGYYEALTGRVYFHSADPGRGDGNIQLTLLTPSDSGIYYCQVKKAPGLRSVKTVVRVLKPPSGASCYSTERAGVVGKTKVLHCGTQEGAPPVWYHWGREPPWELLSTSAVLDATAGTLTILDASAEDEGTYKCTVLNRVGTDICFLELDITQPPAIAMIVGAAAGSLAAIGVISAGIYFLVKHLRRKPKEIPNEIVEDASPPRHPRKRKPYPYPTIVEEKSVL